jgi:uncharacterized protein (DUF362 family)
MKFIHLDDGTMLNVNAVKSYKAEQRESVQEIFEPVGGSGISKKTGDRVTQETVLKIETKDGESHTLKGSAADAALKVLKGCP